MLATVPIALVTLHKDRRQVNAHSDSERNDDDSNSEEHAQQDSTPLPFEHSHYPQGSQICGQNGHVIGVG